MLVIIEENYKISVWCREITDGLRKEARKKRITLTLCSDINDASIENSEKTVIIIGSETEWLNSTVHKALSLGKHPIILSNQSEGDFGRGVSRVTDDIFGSMGEIMSLFSAKGYNKTALYACNPDSASDSFKKEAFLKSGGSIDDIFSNEGSLDLCFSRFYEKHKETGYGGIVCANDFAAISLIRHLKDHGEILDNIDIISYSDTLISKCTSPAVSSVSASFKSFGHLAFMIADCIGKGENISGIRVLCDWEIKHRETSSPVAHTPMENNLQSSEKSGSFYSDPALMEMMRIEDLLSQCDQTDVAIINSIIKGKTTAEIELSCFLAETAVKYRIKKMKEICHAESRAELREIFSKYLSCGIDKKLLLEYN